MSFHHCSLLIAFNGNVDIALWNEKKKYNTPLYNLLLLLLEIANLANYFLHFIYGSFWIYSAVISYGAGCQKKAECPLTHWRSSSFEQRVKSRGLLACDNVSLTIWPFKMVGNICRRSFIWQQAVIGWTSHTLPPLS